MSAKSGWVATAVGTAVGTGGWIVGLGKLLWPVHPQWAHRRDHSGCTAWSNRDAILGEGWPSGGRPAGRDGDDG